MPSEELSNPEAPLLPATGTVPLQRRHDVDWLRTLAIGLLCGCTTIPQEPAAPAPEAAPVAPIGEMLQESATELNKRAPVMLSEVVRLDRVEVKGQQFIGYHTVLLPYGTLSQAQLDAVKDNTYETICQDKKMYWVLWNGVKFVYIYYYETGQTAGRITLSIADCAKAGFGDPTRIHKAS